MDVLTSEVLRLATCLGMTRKQVEGLGIKFAKEHGQHAAPKLEAYLSGLERETRDEPRLLRSRPPVPTQRTVGPPTKAEIEEAHEQGAYTANGFQALRNEPEAVGPQELESFAKDGRERFEAGNPYVAKKSERSLGHQVRQAVAQARNEGRDVEPHVQQIQAIVEEIIRGA